MVFFYYDKNGFNEVTKDNPQIRNFLGNEDTKDNSFQEQEGIEYVDLFSQDNDDVIVGTGTQLDGKTLNTYAQEKGLCQAAADGIYGGIRSLINLATIPAYKTTNFCLSGDWGDFENDAQSAFDETLPPEVPPTTTGEGIVQGVSKFATTAIPSSGIGKVTGLTGKTGVITNATIKGWSKTEEGLKVGKILAPAIDGMITDSTAFWQDKENLSTIINNNIDNPYIKAISDWMAIKEDDDVADRMLKQALEGIFVNSAVTGIFKVLKGVKNYSKQVIANARLKEQGKRLAEDIVELKTQEMIKADKTAPKLEKGVVNVDIAKETKDALKEEAQKSGVIIPRAPERISVEEAEKAVYQRMVDLGFSDNAEYLTEEQLKTLSKDAKNMVEKVIPFLDEEEKAFTQNLLKIKQSGVDFAGGIITKEERNQHFIDALEELAEKFGKTQDVLYDSGKTLGYASTRQTHSDIKKILKSISDNADELTKDKLFDIFSNATSTDELRAKLIKLGYLEDKALKHGGWKNVSTTFTALEQAGLMSSPSTMMRNILTSMEMAVEQVGTKVIGGGISWGKRELRRLFKLGEPVSGIDVRESLASLGAYFDAVVDGLDWFAKKVSGNVPGESFTSQYRNSASRQAMSMLPKEVGQTFQNESMLSGFLKKWVTYSGVGLSEKVDNWFESVFYRGEVRSRALEYAERIGREKNLSKEQIKKLAGSIADRATDMDLTGRRNLIKNTEDVLADDLVVYSIANKARKDATKLTFRSGRGPVTNKISNIMSEAWFLRPLVPFFKTGSTIFFDRFLGDLTPIRAVGGLIPGVKTEFYSIMKKGGREADEVLGRMILGSSVMVGGYALALNGKITGDYSTDPKVRAAQVASGWQPNSWVFEHDDGSKGYLSLNYLGPLAYALKYPAKLMSTYADYRNKLELPEEDYNTGYALTAVALSFAADAMDEAMLRYFADGYNLLNYSRDEKDALSKITELGAKTVTNVVPRGIGEAVTGIKYLVDTDAIKQGVDTMTDELVKKLGMNTYDKHDVFGNPIKDKNPLLNLIGVKYVPDEKYDPELEYLASIGVGFSMPKKSIEVFNQRLEISDVQAENIKKEMKNLNAEKSIKELVSDKDFRKMPKIVQKQQVENTFAIFRNAAIMNYYMKDVELQEQYKNKLDRLSKMYEEKPQENIPSMRLK